MIRYSFVGNTDRDMKVTVDNGTYDVTFKSTGSWDKWDTAYVEDVWVDALDFKVKFASATSDGGPNIDMIAFDIKGVYRTGCKPAKVANEADPPVRIAPVREMQLQPAPAKSFNALGRRVPASVKARKYPAIRTFSR